ncbi:Hypothetical protein FKW44_014905 [Caligus rogercresseyi]|uniref:Uncharacterized protein n=1 Tax=Caligus rogercresseyi TaxID=217165 RepID=A0A7T8GZI5_CALRO|nr:Hypothetical protein FKW44_014905 [Caligus rogercresseyi]
MEEFIGMLNVEDNLEHPNDVADRARSLLDGVEDPMELIIRMTIAKAIPKDSRQLLLSNRKMGEEDFKIWLSHYEGLIQSIGQYQDLPTPIPREAANRKRMLVSCQIRS